MRSKLTVALAASVSILATCTARYAHAESIFDTRWGPWFESGGQVSTNRSLGEANLFVPLSQDSDTLLFTDLRGMFDDQNAREGNFGLGLRQMLSSGWNVGAYGYYDIRRSSYGNTFHQVTLGAEALSETFDLRANAYLPVGESEVRMGSASSSSTGPWTSQAVITGTSLAIQHQAVKTTTTSYEVEKAMAGVDAEVGVRLPVFEPDSGFDLRAFFGGYYFDGSGVEAVGGPRARLELTAHDLAGIPGVKVTGGVTYQSDNVRGDQWIAEARLRVPLQPPASAPDQELSHMERRMMDAVVRDVDIVSNTGNATNSTDTTLSSTEDAINTWNGDVVSTFAQVDGATQDLAALQAALDAAGTGGVVLLTGNLAAPGGILLNANQTLIGGGATLKLRGASSGVEVDFTAAGSSGRITGADDALVEMATGSTLSGISVENTATGANDFAVVGASGATLDKVDIISSANGVKADGTTGFTLEGGSVTANQGSALDLTNSTGLDVSDAAIVQNGASGLGIRADNAAGTISNNRITTNGNGNGLDDIDPSARPAHAVKVNNSGSLSIGGNTITTNGTQANGIHVTNSAGIEISDNSITTNNYMSRGIHLLDSNNATLSGNTIATRTTDDTNWSYLTIAFGLMTDRSSNLSIRDNVITTQMRGGHGIYIRYGSDNLVEGNTVTTAGEGASAVSVLRSTSAMVRDNVVTTTNMGTATGIYFGIYSDNGTAEGNTVTVLGGTANVVVNMASGVTIRGNRLVGRGNSGVWTSEGDTTISGNTP
ncbi:hypothetical protein HHL25_22810 [Rhizobium sp. S-51]|uniref:Uncharacterized protein n=1 Tax=Rhizobium terricola TaxID=2728849 RepID=A0A7Y0B0W5_9HYPH|nr:right-handed parallel beta-helix repeat-containing protein [Rhizobium terricola]NML76973.1 hypothetical protein [Rhizobium terricola]